MASVPISDEVAQDAVTLLQTHGNQTAAATAAGIARSTFQNRLHRAAERGFAGTRPVLPGYAIKKTSTQLGPDGELQREWVQQTKAPGEAFEVPAGHTVKGVSAYLDGQGQVLGQWVKTNQVAVAVEAAIRTVVDELKKELPRVQPIIGPAYGNALLANQFTVTDLHLGMLAWAEETGGEDYDIKIAEKLLIDWFSAAIAMAPNAQVGILAQLGDLMHHDSKESVTPAHRHILDADSRLQKIIRVVIRVIRQIIVMLLQKHERVHVVMADANHDPASSAWMRELLYSMYEDEPRITIDNSPDTYYAYEFGYNALFYHHGHKRKAENVDQVFVGKFRELYGRAKQCYGHVGHLHSDAVIETNLMRIERHRTLAPADAYSAGGGWLSKRDAKVITYHSEYGEVSRITLSPQMVRAANDNVPVLKEAA